MTIIWPTVMIYAVGLSLLLTLLIIPQVLHISLERRLFDRPNERKIHNGVVPRLGGFSFLPVMILTLGIIMAFPDTYTVSAAVGQSPGMTAYLPDSMVLFGAMVIMFLTGLHDDLAGVKYGVKFLAQIIAAIILVAGGNYIVDFQDFLGLSQTSIAVGGVISCFLIVYIVNSLNLIDGIDGLAAGICIVALTCYAIVLYGAYEYFYSMLCWIAVASLAVFWCFNVFGSKRKHTKIFMGDIGSLSIGVFVAFIVMEVCGSANNVPAGSGNYFVLAFSPLVIPLFDVIRVFCIRIFHGQSPFLPDKRHIHHLMLKAGWPMRGVMVYLILVQLCIIALNMWLSEWMNTNLIVLVDVGAYALCILAKSAPFLPKSKNAVS